MADRGRGRLGRRPVERPRRHRLISTGILGERRTRIPGAALAAVLVGVLVLATGVAPAEAVPAQWWLSKFGITQANKLSTGAGVTVAVLDTGVVANRIGDLTGQVVGGVDLTNSGGPNVDAGEGCNEQGGCYSHGTQMSLLIAGTGRGAGMVGVAPGAKIMPIKVNTRTGAGDISAANVAAGIRYAVDHGAKIISMSIGARNACSAVETEASRYAYEKGVLLLAAAGNDGQPPVQSPANCPGVIAIGGVNQDDTPYAKTNSGPEVSFAQADGGVQETLSQKILTNTSGSDDGKGTSDATAIAAGCFALLRAKFPNDSARMLVTRAINHPYADVDVPIGKRESDQTGYGVVLPYNAMTKPTASTAPNPLFDKFAQQFPNNGGGPSSSSPGGSGPSTPTGSQASSSSGGNGTVGAAPSDSSSGGHAGLIVGVLVALVVIVLILIAVFVRSRSRRVPAGTAPPPPGQWNPPNQFGAGPPPGQGNPSQGNPGQAPPGQWPQGGPPSGPPPSGHR